MVVDTSAWVDYLQDRESDLGQRVDDLIRQDGPVVTDPVIAELLVGATDDLTAQRLRRLLATFDYVAADGSDWVAAAGLQRTCRRAGETVRQLTDCLIAAVAVRLGVPVLTRDRDFLVLARHTALELA